MIINPGHDAESSEAVNYRKLETRKLDVNHRKLDENDQLKT